MSLSITISLATCLFVAGASAINDDARERAERAAAKVRMQQGFLVRTSEARADIGKSLEVVFGASGPGKPHRIGDIEANMWATFQALPKNSFGRLAPRAVRHIVHLYFSKVHGWIIEGLGPHGMGTSISAVHDASIIQSKAPVLAEALSESHRLGSGVSFADVVALVAALEQLVHDESMNLLEGAYMLNDISPNSLVDEDSLHDILATYLLVFGMDHANVSALPKQKKMKARATEAGGSLAELMDIEHDSVLNFDYDRRGRKNPFARPTYSFENAFRIAEDTARGYAQWQNRECHQIKDVLVRADPEGSGHLLLTKFYGLSDTTSYQFSESVEYLRTTGALDESVPDHPRVRITNYLLGPSNCVAASTYYSVCCISECNDLMDEIESNLKAPFALPEQLLGLVSNLSSSTVSAPRRLSAALVDKLHKAAAHHNGNVLIHGRLFAQWLHNAFPNECPYPHIVDDAGALLQTRWPGSRIKVDPEERERLCKMPNTTGEAQGEFQQSWSDHEVLPAHEPHGVIGIAGRVLQLLSQATALLLVLSSVVGMWRASMRANIRSTATETNAKALQHGFFC